MVSGYDAVPIQNCMNHVDGLLPLHFNFSLEYTIRKIKGDHKGLVFNVTQNRQQFLFCANDVNLLEKT
jgi:hypothetical protein